MHCSWEFIIYDSEEETVIFLLRSLTTSSKCANFSKLFWKNNRRKKMWQSTLSHKKGLTHFIMYSMRFPFFQFFSRLDRLYTMAKVNHLLFWWHFLKKKLCIWNEYSFWNTNLGEKKSVCLRFLRWFSHLPERCSNEVNERAWNEWKSIKWNYYGRLIPFSW